MFNIGFAELILVLLVAFLVVGPRDLPKVARWLGRTVKKARQLIKELRKESGWDDMMAETEEVRRDIEQTVKEGDITADLRSASKELNKSISDARKQTGIKKP